MTAVASYHPFDLVVSVGVTGVVYCLDGRSLVMRAPTSFLFPSPYYVNKLQAPHEDKSTTKPFVSYARPEKVHKKGGMTRSES
nr:unnamed protein product [Spirometra erinaceieuropaei]